MYENNTLRISWLYPELFYDSSYIPKNENDGDEVFVSGIFTFHISRLREDLFANAKYAVSVRPYEVDKLCEIAFGVENKEYDPSLDLNSPVLLGEIAPDSYVLIDGYHRLKKAEQEGVKRIPACFVPMEILSRYFTDMKGYRTFIRYWNEKISMAGEKPYSTLLDSPAAKSRQYTVVETDAAAVWESLILLMNETESIEVQLVPGKAQWFSLGWNSHGMLEMNKARVMTSCPLTKAVVIDRQSIELCLPYYERWMRSGSLGRGDISKITGQFTRCEMALIRMLLHGWCLDKI